MNIINWLIAKIMSGLLSVATFFYTIYVAIRHKQGWKYIDGYFKKLAYAESLYANTAFVDLLNALFVKSGGYLYGARGEGLSSATGKNWTLHKQTFLGKGLTGFLNLIDVPNWKNGGHCWVYIETSTYSYGSLPASIAWYYTAAFTFIVLSLCSLAVWLITLFCTLFF